MTVPSVSPPVRPGDGDADLAAALRRELDGRWREIREQAREALTGIIEPGDAGRPLDEQRDDVLDRLLTLAKAGHAGLGFPKEYGGRGDLGGSVASFEMLGHGDLSLMVKAGVQWGLFGGAVHALGTRAHHERYLRDIMTGDLLGCFAMTETGHGSDVQAIRTTARYDAATQEFVVTTPDRSARKDYIGNAARHGRLAVVFAQLETGGAGRGVHAVLVPIRDEAGDPMPGVTIEDDGLKAGLNGVDNGRLEFHDVRVPREALLDRYGHVAADGAYTSPIESESRRFFTMLGTLVRGRISVAGAAVSASKSALTIAVRYGDRRRQFDRPAGKDGTPAGEVPVLDYLAHQRRLLPALARTYALHFAQGEVVATLHDLQAGRLDVVERLGEQEPDPDADRRQRELEARAAGLKAVATWHATASIQTAREACGGAGYLAENRLPQLKADSDVFTTFEGDNTVLLQLVAKGLLTSYRDHVGELDQLGTVLFVADQVAGTLVERTAVRALLDRLQAVAPGREEGDLRDRSWQRRMFADREEHLLEGVARRLRRASRGDAFEVFNAAQPHLLELARAHVHRLVLESFVAGVDACEDPAAARLLDAVCDLYALSTIEAERAWYLEHGRLTPGRSKEVTRTVDKLCGELRPHAVTLVNAWGIPDSWLSAEILRP
jgi:acyl-CoA oxidase